MPDEPVADHDQHGGHEGVGGDGERGAGLADAAQVQQCDDEHNEHREQHPVRGERRHGRQEVRHAGGHRDGDGQHVVDHQGAGDQHPEIAAEVGGGDLVITAAAGIRVNVLAVGSDDGEHQNAHHCCDVRREVDERQAAEREHEEDLLGGVRDGRKGVAREDRKRDLLGQQCFAEAVAPDRPADHAALQQAREQTHGAECYAASTWQVARSAPTHGYCSTPCTSSFSDAAGWAPPWRAACPGAAIRSPSSISSPRRSTGSARISPARP